MSTVTVEEVQARLPEIIHQLAPGEKVFITEAGQVVARLVGESRLRPGPGLCKGMITIVADDEQHLDDFAEHMP